MPTMPTIARGAGGILKNVLKNDLEFLVLYLLLISLSSIPISVGILIGVLRRGRDTQFSDSNPRLGFTPGPSTRGTMNIVWLCMSTIFTCVYVSVHIDVRDKDKVGAFANMLEDSARGSTDEHSPSPDDLPPPMSYTPSNDVEKVSDDAPDDKLDGDSSSVDRNSISTPEIHIPLPRLLRRGCAALWRFFAHAQCRRIFWMLFNVFAPELVVFVAVLERISASDGVQFMRERKQKWNVQLAFFADMGGFEIAEGTFVGRKGKLTKTKRFRNGLQLMKWVTKYDVHFKADILAKQIDDRCKANRVLKVFTCTQAAWLFVETILRLVQKKPVSELEVATCSYIFCTLITYCCWMHKPYDVHHSITIRQEWLMRPDRVASDATAIEVQGGPIDSEIKTAGQVEDTERSQTKLPSMIYPQARFTPFNRAYRHPGHSWRFACVVSGVVGALVGLFHAVPLWDALFINTTGQWLWRSCCFFQVTLPLFIAISSVLEIWYHAKPLFATMLLTAFVYALSRIVLFGLIWISFWSLPAGVYLDVDLSWAYFPHWH